MILQDDYMNIAIKKRDHFVIGTGVITSCTMNGIEKSIKRSTEKSR